MPSVCLGVLFNNLSKINIQICSILHLHTVLLAALRLASPQLLVLSTSHERLTNTDAYKNAASISLLAFVIT